VAVFSLGLLFLRIEHTLLAFLLLESFLFLIYFMKAYTWVTPLHDPACRKA
jgi:hypothetical protein